jgi:hypothetical protein
MDLTKEAEVVQLMQGSKSEDEWNANCDQVKAANKGYPSFWWPAIVQSGLMAQVRIKYGF